AAVVKPRQYQRSAVGEAKFIADEGRNAALARDAAPVKEIARVESCVTQEFEYVPVHGIRPGFGDDLRETRRPFAHGRRHDARFGSNLINRVHVEISKRGAAKLRVRSIAAVHGEDGCSAALAVDSELLGEISGAVRIGGRT